MRVVKATVILEREPKTRLFGGFADVFEVIRDLAGIAHDVLQGFRNIVGIVLAHAERRVITDAMRGVAAIMRA